jgi:hypothetical protein
MKITVRKSDNKLICWNGRNDNNDPLLVEYNVSDTFPEGDFSRMFYDKYSNSIIIKPFSAQEIYEIELSKCLAQRRQAYATESDPLKNEIEYDGGDLAFWRGKVTDIKLRYPKPVMPDTLFAKAQHL